MKRRSIRLALQAAPRDYRPDYPARLSPERYRELVAPRSRLRLHAAVMATGLACAGPMAQDSTIPNGVCQKAGPQR